MHFICIFSKHGTKFTMIEEKLKYNQSKRLLDNSWSEDLYSVSSSLESTNVKQTSLWLQRLGKLSVNR